MIPILHDVPQAFDIVSGWKSHLGEKRRKRPPPGAGPKGRTPYNGAEPASVRIPAGSSRKKESRHGIAA
jgi:hypothetical protein